MRSIRLADYCCQGGDKVIDQASFTESDLVISKDGNRDLIFSPLGNQPRFPKLALVGITPGAQSEKFASLLRNCDVPIAAKKAAFSGAHEVIKTILTAHGFLDALGVSCPSDLNESEEIFTTSLVKCCLRVDKSYKYAAPDIAASKAASYCLSNRFVRDIEAYETIRYVVIFGDPGWEAVETLAHQRMSIRRYLESRGITVLNMPHFAQNFQQRAIYTLNPLDDEAYFQRKPKHRPYWSKANRMRKRTIDEVGLLAQLAGGTAP